MRLEVQWEFGERNPKTDLGPQRKGQRPTEQRKLHMQRYGHLRDWGPFRKPQWFSFGGGGAGWRDCRVRLAGRGQIRKGFARDLRQYLIKYLSWNTLSFSVSPGSQLKPPSSLFPDPGLGQVPYCALSKLPVLGASSS